MNKAYIAVACLIAFGLGIFAGVKWVAPALTTPHYCEEIVEKPAEIKETVRHEVETVIKYVPKETIVYKDPATGIETIQKETTDIEADIKHPSVNVKVNGEDYAFNLLQGEKQKFEDGKVVLNQTSDIGIELTVRPQVIDKTKHGGIDIIAGKYSGIGVKHKRIGVDVTKNIQNNDTMIQGRYKVIEW